MQSSTITRQQADELLAFLPAFSDSGASYVKRWAGTEPLEDGSLTFPYPVYEEDVVAFFGLAGRPHWMDTGYQPAEAGRMLADDAFIAACTLDQFKTMLTYCVRGERFGDGHWAALLESGRIAALLRRLAQLRDMLPDG